MRLALPRRVGPDDVTHSRVEIAIVELDVIQPLRRDVHRGVQRRLIRGDGDVLARRRERRLLRIVRLFVLGAFRREIREIIRVDRLGFVPSRVPHPRRARREPHEALALAPPLRPLRLHHRTHALDVIVRVSLPLVKRLDAAFAHQFGSSSLVHYSTGVLIHRAA